MDNFITNTNVASITEAFVLGGIDTLKVFVGYLSFAVARKYRVEKNTFPNKVSDWIHLSCVALLMPFASSLFLNMTGLIYFISSDDGGFIRTYTFMALCSLWGAFAIKQDELLRHIHKGQKEADCN
jgi:hypothetical protein